MDQDDVASYLQLASKGLLDGANLFLAQPKISAALRIAGGLIGIGAGLLRKGEDPVEKVTRLLDLDAQMNAARDEVDAEARKQFEGG